MLDDAAREAADRFAATYAALRRLEGWVGPNGREDPEGGEPRLWRARLESVSEAAAAISSQRTATRRPVVADIGSGGGWAARYLQDADVIAIDLIEAQTPLEVLHVRGDMRRLPVRDATVDVALYAASLHYAPIRDSIREAARVLRPGGLIVAVDSPMYRDCRAQARAEAPTICMRAAPEATPAPFPFPTFRPPFTGRLAQR